MICTVPTDYETYAKVERGLRNEMGIQLRRRPGFLPSYRDPKWNRNVVVDCEALL
jgi:hypothetical protein